MKVQTVFERHEKKFLLPKARLNGFLQALDEYCQPDDYGRYTICSLYLDTQDYRSGRQQLDKPAFREKLRLRSYGVPRADSTVYLELKKKVNGVSYKRRLPLQYEAAENYLLYGLNPGCGGQVFGEIDWFVRQNRPVPKAVICYDRIALQGRENPALRITFDENVRWRNEGLYLDKGDWGSPLVRPGTVLMEIKTPGAMPFWLCRLLSQNKTYAQPFSKYGTAYRAILCERRQEHAG